MKPLAALLLCILFGGILNPVLAQPDTPGNKGRRTRKDKDDIPVFTLPSVDINTTMTKAERRRYMERMKEYEKLRRNIRLVLPLAKQCGKVVNDLNAEVAQMDKKKEKKYFMDKLEKELFKKYEHQIKRLTVNQGKLLIKLIYRETDNSAYALIEEYRSWRSAAFWQMIARIFGSNLKEKYDPQQEAVIEMIVRQIENGTDEQYKVTFGD
jgi:hypothetical protein